MRPYTEDAISENGVSNEDLASRSVDYKWFSHLFGYSICLSDEISGNKRVRGSRVEKHENALAIK